MYKNKRIGDRVTNRKINIELYCLSNMLRKAIEWNHLNSKPKIELLEQETKPPKFLNENEIRILLDSASEWLKPMLIVFINTGVRRHELFNIRFIDINYDRRTLTVRSNKTNDFRLIPVNNELYKTLLFLKDNYIHPSTGEVINRTPEQKEYVFCNLNGKN